MTDTQVLVAGGGPVGLAAAIELGRRGIECRVIEPRLTVSHDRPRCETVNVRSMEHLRRWGIADRLRALAPLPVAWSQDIVFSTSLAGTSCRASAACSASLLTTTATPNSANRCRNTCSRSCCVTSRQSFPSLMGPIDRDGTWWIIAFGVDRASGERDARTIRGPRACSWSIALVIAACSWPATPLTSTRPSAETG